MSKVVKVIWTNSVKDQLKMIFAFYNEKSKQGASNIKSDIFKAVKSIVFAEQYEQDEIESEYRKIIVRDYKILYKAAGDTIYIVKIFSMKRFPDSQLK